MAETIEIEQLSDAIAKELKQYTDDVVDAVNISSKKIGQEAVRQLKRTSPKKTGKYAKGWRVKTEKKFGRIDSRIIHNATSYQLTHLLEKGHAKVNGGRVAGITHIRPVEETVIKEFTAAVEEAIKSGSG